MNKSKAGARINQIKRLGEGRPWRNSHKLIQQIQFNQSYNEIQVLAIHLTKHNNKISKKKPRRKAAIYIVSIRKHVHKTIKAQITMLEMSCKEMQNTIIFRPPKKSNQKTLLT